jgi:hypothetical protein
LRRSPPAGWTVSLTFEPSASRPHFSPAFFPGRATFGSPPAAELLFKENRTPSLPEMNAEIAEIAEFY